MIWKLCKIDFKSTYRTYFLMYLILFLAGVMIQLGKSPAEIFSFTSLLGGMLYAASIVSLILSFFVNMIKNFYQSMFGRQSYLSHTLPVTSTQLLLSKLITGLFWILLSICMILLSLFISFMVYTLLGGVSDMQHLIHAIQNEFIAYDVWIEIFKEGLYSIVGLLNTILFLFLIITLVNTCYIRNRKVLLAILYSFTYTICLGYMKAALNLSPELMCVFNFILSIVYFVLCRYLIDNKMELE